MTDLLDKFLAKIVITENNYFKIVELYAWLIKNY